MITADRTRHIAAPPEAVFAALSDPARLAGLLPRVRRIELIERDRDRVRIAAHMALGPFGDLRCEGEVRWRADREIVFCSRLPVLVESRWTLAPANGGTDLRGALARPGAAARSARRFRPGRSGHAHDRARPGRRAGRGRQPRRRPAPASGRRIMLPLRSTGVHAAAPL